MSVSASQSASLRINGITSSGPGLTLLANPELQATNVTYGDYFAETFTVNPVTSATSVSLGDIQVGGVIWVQTDSPVDVILTQDVLAAGVSTSDTSAAISVSAGQTLLININGDGIHSIALAANSTGVAIAADIKAKVQALAAVTPSNQPAFSGFSAVFNGVTNQYTLVSGVPGVGSSVVISGGSAAPGLLLGLANGGVETVGSSTIVDRTYTVDSFLYTNATFTAIKFANNSAVTAANINVTVAGTRPLNTGAPGIY